MSRRLRRTISLSTLGIALCAALFYLLDRSPSVDWSAIDYELGPSSAAVFDPQKLLTFSLDLRPSDWGRMRAQPKAEAYVPATLHVGSEVVGKVGLRFKGAKDSLRDLKLDPNRLPKLSLKIRFDEYQKGQRFHGLRRINLHAMRRDGSLLRDRLSYELLRAFGLKAPRCTHAQVVINGQVEGLFALVEQVDEVFTADRFSGKGKFSGKSKGQLYKEAWPHRIDQDYFSSHLKSSKKRADHSPIQSFARSLLTRDDASLVAGAAAWTDLSTLLRYAVASTVIGNWDGALAWTGSRDTGFQNYNYYWYLDPGSRGFYLIPWDLDRTLHPRLPNAALPPWHQLDLDRSVSYLQTADTQFRAATHDPLLRALALYAVGKRRAVVQEFLDGPFSKQSTDALIDLWSSQIQAGVKRDRSLPGGFGLRRVWTWEAATAALRLDLKTLRLMAAASIG